jgi:tRNA A37 threonylcarbamoyladenosine synthetase subunit TsaC/SUA5/YrdC
MPHVDARELDDEFPGIDLILDGGPGGISPTTVIDLTGAIPKIVRAGAGDITPFLER